MRLFTVSFNKIGIPPFRFCKCYHLMVTKPSKSITYKYLNVYTISLFYTSGILSLDAVFSGSTFGTIMGGSGFSEEPQLVMISL